MDAAATTRRHAGYNSWRILQGQRSGCDTTSPQEPHGSGFWDDKQLHGDLSWLLHRRDFDEHTRLPPIVQNEPVLFLIWGRYPCSIWVSSTYTPTSLPAYLPIPRQRQALQNLHRLIKEGRLEGQENIVLAIDLLGRDPECVEQMLLAGELVEGKRVFVKMTISRFSKTAKYSV